MTLPLPLVSEWRSIRRSAALIREREPVLAKPPTGVAAAAVRMRPAVAACPSAFRERLPAARRTWRPSAGPCSRLDRGRNGPRRRRAGADVEDARLVDAVGPEHHAMPVDRAEERPGSDASDIDAGVARCARRCPGVVPPGDLVARVSGE